MKVTVGGKLVMDTLEDGGVEERNRYSMPKQSLVVNSLFVIVAVGAYLLSIDTFAEAFLFPLRGLIG